MIEDSFDIELVPEVGDGLGEQARRAKAETTARRLHSKGLAGGEIAFILEVSPQLLKPDAQAAGRRRTRGRRASDA